MKPKFPVRIFENFFVKWNGNSTRSRSMPARAKFSKDSKWRICNRSSSVSEFKFVDEFALTNDI